MCPKHPAQNIFSRASFPPQYLTCCVYQRATVPCPSIPPKDPMICVCVHMYPTELWNSSSWNKSIFICESVCLSACLYMLVCSSEFHLTLQELHLCVQMSPHSDFSQDNRFSNWGRNHHLPNIHNYVLDGVFRYRRNTPTKYIGQRLIQLKYGGSLLDHMLQMCNNK